MVAAAFIQRGNENRLFGTEIRHPNNKMLVTIHGFQGYNVRKNLPLCESCLQIKMKQMIYIVPNVLCLKTQAHF